MRKALVAALLTAATFVSAPAFAQDSDKKIGIGGDLLFVLPVGDFADASGPQIGPVGRFGYRVIPQLEITGRVGYLHGFSKEQAPGLSSGVSTIPIWGGARYFFMQNPLAGAYAGAEVGANFQSFRLDPGESDSSTRFGYNLAGGYVISPELPLDFRLQFMHYNLLGKESRDLPGGFEVTESNQFGLGLSVGYTYQL